MYSWLLSVLSTLAAKKLLLTLAVELAKRTDNSLDDVIVAQLQEVLFPAEEK
jgi:hypothetical protein